MKVNRVKYFKSCMEKLKMPKKLHVVEKKVRIIGKLQGGKEQGEMGEKGIQSKKTNRVGKPTRKMVAYSDTYGKRAITLARLMAMESWR